MRSLVSALLLLIAGTMPAAAATIDFEEFSVGDLAPLASNGFLISGFGADSQSGFFCCDARVNDDSGSKALFAETYSDSAFSPPAELSFAIQRQSGGAFSLYSMDIYPSFGISGTRASDGATINGTVADLGAGDWLNITWAGFNVSAEGPFYGSYTVDNIVVSAVPIPAAVWLFGSALAGLGWMRRKQITSAVKPLLLVAGHS